MRLLRMGKKGEGREGPLERTRLVCSGPSVAHLSWTVLALVLSFVLILTRLRYRTVFRLLRALSSLLSGPIGLLTDVLRLSTHDSPQRIQVSDLKPGVQGARRSDAGRAPGR
jgi:hypothetical protein